MRPMILLLALSLSACALVRPTPTAEDCARLASELAVANNAVSLSRVALTAAVQAGAKPDVVDRINHDLAITQAAVDSLSVLQRQKCAAPTPV